MKASSIFIMKKIKRESKREQLAYRRRHVNM